MIDDKTSVFDLKLLRQELLLYTLDEVIASLERNGYNAKNQLAGFIVTNDFNYITQKENARKKLSQFTREEILLAIINGYMGK